MATNRRNATKSIEDSLRTTIADMTTAQNRLEASLRKAEDEAREWRAKYIDSGRWRKYLPTAFVSLAIGFGIGLLV